MEGSEGVGEEEWQGRGCEEEEEEEGWGRKSGKGEEVGKGVQEGGK